MMTLILINLTDTCVEILCTSFLFHTNIFNLSYFNKKCLIAESKMNCVC